MRPYTSGIRHDYKDEPTAARAFDPRSLSWFAVGLVLPLASVMLLLVSGPNEATPRAEDPAALPSPVAIALLPSSGERVALELPPPSRPVASQLQRPEDIERNALLARGEALTLVVKRNDSLDRLFRRNDLSVSDLDQMVRIPESGRELGRINPGDEIEIIRDGPRVLSLHKALGDSQELWIKQDGEGYTAEIIDLEKELRTAGASGIIDSSLWNAAIDAGLETSVIGEIAGIFEWDIDFQREVRQGDSFTVVYEEIWRDGKKLGNGQIIAAEFVNRGDVYRAARYIDADGLVGYYTPEGLSVKRPFLRNPIEFNSRVSSSFNPNRRHPILNTIRAHRGVDLAVPTGTPIRAAGAGKIIARGEYGSFGNRVEIQHGGNITTLYAHMSRFGNFRVGDRVNQGDVIGYVGMTGGATGPHLHYEYRVNGVHRDPLRVELPDAEPIDERFRNDFQLAAKSLWRQLDLYQGPLLASND